MNSRMIPSHFWYICNVYSYNLYRLVCNLCSRNDICIFSGWQTHLVTISLTAQLAAALVVIRHCTCVVIYSCQTHSLAHTQIKVHTPIHR